MTPYPPLRLADIERIRRLHYNPKGQTEVWYARAPNGEEVALKLITRGSEAEERDYRYARFRDEVEAGLQLRHEHLRRLRTYGSDPTPLDRFPDGVDFLVFEWIEGITLGERLAPVSDRNPRVLAAREWRDLAHAVSNALITLHRATPPWIHRDVKPANILIPGGDLRRSLLADLGIAWREGSPRHSHVVGLSDSGTAPYMAPEQLAGAPEITAAADQYALALVLWECATGRVPHSASSRRSDLLRARRAGAPLSPFTLQGETAPEIERVLSRALAPDARHRWNDVQGFWIALHSAGVVDGCWDPDISVRPLGDVAVPPPAPGEADDPGFGVPEVWLEQRAHLASFVERTEILARCRAWIRSESSASYLALLGTPGQGKSAAMAKLAALEGADGLPTPFCTAEGVCLLHMVKSHRGPRRILQALIWQAERYLGVRSSATVYTADVEDLRNTLADVLTRLAARSRVTIVLDALDELAPEGRDLRFLPKRLPTRVRCVLSTRPDADLVGALRSRLDGVEEQVMPALTLDEAGSLAAAMFGMPVSSLERVLDVKALYKLTGGIPLLLRRAAVDLRDEVQHAATKSGETRVSLNGVATSLEAAFREDYASLSGQRGAGILPEVVRVQRAIVRVLAGAQAALDVTAVRGVLRAAGYDLPREEVQSVLDGMSEYLLPLPARYTLYHKGLSDYVLRYVLDPDEIAAVHGWFLHWLGASTRVDGYYEAHVTAHHEEHCRALADAEDPALPHAVRAWARELSSARYVQARVMNGHVYELQREFTWFGTSLRDGLDSAALVRDAVDFSQEFDEMACWACFLDQRAHVLAQHPDLLVQELRNSPEDMGLRDFGESLSVTRPILVVRKREGGRSWPSYLVRQTISMPPVQALAMDAESGRFATLHTDGTGVGQWDANDGRGLILPFPKVAAVKMIGVDAKTRSTVLAVGVATGGGAFLVEGPGPFPWRDLPWPQPKAFIRCMCVGGGAILAVFSRADGLGPHRGAQVHRIPLLPSEPAWCAEIGMAIRHLAVSPDGSWVVVGTQASEDGPSEIRVLEASSGTELSRIALEEPTYWLGVSHIGILLSSHRAAVRFWAVPHLRELGQIGARGFSMQMTQFHPTKPRVLLMDEYRMYVLDLEHRTIIRTERWRERPGNHAALAEGGQLLVGDLGRYNDAFRGDASVGVWELPVEFWDPAPPEASEIPDSLSRPDAVLHGGHTTLRRVGDSVIAEHRAGLERPQRIFVSPHFSRLTGVVSLDQDRVLVHGDALDVLDVASGRVTQRLRSDTDILQTVYFVEGVWRGEWRPGVQGEHGANLAPDRHKDDAVIADALAEGIPIVSLEAPDAEYVLAPIPWKNADDPSSFGVSTLDIERRAWTDFIEIPGCAHGCNLTEFMPGGRFFIYQPDPETTYVVHAGSGEIVVDFGSDEHPLQVIDGNRIFCCRDFGETFILDVLDGSVAPCGLNLGDLPHFRNEFCFALRPDLRLIVWSSLDAIQVHELQTGRRVAFLPIQGWTGTLEWSDARTVTAHGADGVYLGISLEGYQG